MNTFTFKYIGRIYKNCAPSAAQQQAAANDQAWQDTLKSSYSSEFGSESAMYAKLNSGLDAIVSATSAYSAPVLAAMNAQTLNTASANAEKVNALIGRNAAKGSATPGVESGIVQAEKASAATQVMGTMANEQADITKENANLAISERDKALGLEANLGKVYDPSNELAGQETGAEKVTDAQVNTNAAASKSWMGILGGVASAAVGGLTKSFTGGLLGGGGGGGGPDQNTPTWDPSTGNEIYPGSSSGGGENTDLGEIDVPYW